ncbi:MAG: VC0807 family protein, partial [Verrucomicrobiota bacterium]
MEKPPLPAPPAPAAGAAPSRRPAPPKENLWINLLCNVVLPGYLLSQLSKEGRLGPAWGLVCALAVPVGYGLWDLYKRRTWNALSILGFISVLLTGVLGLMKANALWIAVKEAAIPLLIGVAIHISLRTRQPLVRSLLYNDQVLDT